MKPTLNRSSPRGATLIELMVSMVVLAVALLGFVGTMNSAATASSVSHRRTVGTLVRSGLLDRFAVTRRAVLEAIKPDTWIVDACLDLNSQYLATNPAFDDAFTCPDEAVYRSWVRVKVRANRAWTLETYVERLDQGTTPELRRGCKPEHRYASLGCVAADMYLTD